MAQENKDVSRFLDTQQELADNSWDFVLQDGGDQLHDYDLRSVADLVCGGSGAPEHLNELLVDPDDFSEGCVHE